MLFSVHIPLHFIRLLISKLNQSRKVTSFTQGTKHLIASVGGGGGGGGGGGLGGGGVTKPPNFIKEYQ